MPKEQSPGKPTTRRYSPEEKAAAVRMVRALRAELGTDHGTVQRVARQLGYGIESVRSWVRQVQVDGGARPGITTEESGELKRLRRENAELRRANVISGRFGRLTA
ncbi:MAG: transposase [Mycobacterium sp.]|nr:transposase [Mycobacterium sp.]